MNKIFAIVFLLLVFFFGCSHSQVKLDSWAINPEAIKLKDEAFKLYLNPQFDKMERAKTLKNAINLLNQAITIDSNYYSLYRNKLAFQDELNQQDSAFITAKLIVKKWTKDESTKIALGRYYEFKGDTTSAFKCYKNALSDINNALSDVGPVPDSTNAEYNKYKFEEHEKAKVLILLNQPENAHRILKELFDKESNETIKRSFSRLMVMNRHDCLLYLRPTITF